MESGEEIFLTQNTFRESGSDIATDSIIDDIVSIQKENPKFDFKLWIG
jgi:hypothetical protein